MVVNSIDTLNLSVDQANTLDENSIAYYEGVLHRRIKGPQLEGLTPEWLREAFSDEETHCVEMSNGRKWPLLVPIKYNEDYRTEFFDQHFPGRPAYFLSLPDVLDVNDETIEEIKGVLANVAPEHQALLVYDSRTGSEEDDDTVLPLGAIVEKSSLVISDVTPDSQAFGKGYGRPKVSHFMGTAKRSGEYPLGDQSITNAFARLVERGEYQSVPEEGPTVLTRDDLMGNQGKLLDDIWDIYSGQFELLVEDHPSLQIQPREELERMLLDEDSFNVAYMSEGKVAAFCYFVSNIEKCIWLNPAFYDEKRDMTPGVRLAYFPGIVVDKDKAHQNSGYPGEMIKLLERVYQEAGLAGMQIVFQCTNVSETYIPLIVTRAISGNGVFTFDQRPDKSGSSFAKVEQYDYHILELSVKQ